MDGIKNILFDLDGTIINSQEGIINSILFALKRLEIEEDNKEELKNLIGPPLIDSFSNRYNLDDQSANRAVAFYREYYAEKGVFQNTLYDGIPALVKKLENNGFKLFLATSKPTIYANKILQYFKLDHFFKGIIGSNFDYTRSDKTEIISHIINTYGLNPQTTLMVGDRKYDIIGAKNNDITSVGVTYGFGEIEELKEANADRIIHDNQELTSLLIES